MLIGTLGVIRSGKTALDTLWTLIEAEKKDSEVYANYRIDHPKVKYLRTVDDFMDLKIEEEGINGLATIQEFQVWAESRLSGKEITRMVDKTVLQSGKLGFDILWDAQLSSSVDKRIKLNTTQWFSTRRKIKLIQYEKAWIFRYIFLSERQRLHKFNFPDWKNLKKLVLDKYDTKQLADMKRKWEQNVKEKGLTDDQKLYRAEHTEVITQPDGNIIDAITPGVKDNPIDITSAITSGQMEVVS